VTEDYDPALISARLSPPANSRRGFWTGSNLYRATKAQTLAGRADKLEKTTLGNHDRTNARDAINRIQCVPTSRLVTTRSPTYPQMPPVTRVCIYNVIIYFMTRLDRCAGGFRTYHRSLDPLGDPNLTRAFGLIFRYFDTAFRISVVFPTHIFQYSGVWVPFVVMKRWLHYLFYN